MDSFTFLIGAAIVIWIVGFIFKKLLKLALIIGALFLIFAFLV